MFSGGFGDFCPLLFATFFMKTENQIKSMLNEIEKDLNLQKETLNQTGSFSKSNKKQLEKFIEERQNEIDLLNWVLNKPQTLPF